MKNPLKSTKPTPAPKRREPSLEDKLDGALSKQDVAQSMLGAAVRGLDDASEQLGRVRDEFEAEISRLAGLAEIANVGAVTTLTKADAIRGQVS